MIASLIALAAFAVAAPQVGGPLVPITGPSLDSAVDSATVATPDCELDPDARGCPGYAHARYRIDGGPAGPDAKARAIANDGTECNLVGSVMCTSKGIPLLRSQR